MSRAFASIAAPVRARLNKPSPRRRIADLSVAKGIPLRDVISAIDRNGVGLALLLNADGRLLATVTDGDIRRAMLAGINLGDSLERMLAWRDGVARQEALTALVGAGSKELLALMANSTLRQIPLVDAEGVVVDVALWDELVKDSELGINVLVMAGGYGKRLRPLTEHLPKPMLPLGGKPLLERMVGQLKQAGVKRLSLSTHYKAELIAAHFGDGREFGVEISYLTEEQPLGTAGALALMEGSSEPLLVVNGDIVTNIDFRAMVDFHHEHRADLTMAVREYRLRVPFGVVDIDGVRVSRVTEKPEVDYFINAGIYLLNPGVREFVPLDQACDMPDLIERLIAAGRTVVGFPVREYWVDIGHIEDYERAVADLAAAGVEPSS